MTFIVFLWTYFPFREAIARLDVFKFWNRSLFAQSDLVLGLVETFKSGPGKVTLLVRASSRYAKAAGSIPNQGTYKNQPKNV